MGRGTTKDYAKAFQYFTQAANQGDAQSIYAVAYMTFKGQGCKQDYAKAAVLFKGGALAGRGNSMYYYGICWKNRYGLPKNEDASRYWFKQGGDQWI